MSERPKWVRALCDFIGDEIVDEEYDYPMDGADDELLERIEEAVNAILCAKYGHVIEHDQCGIPSHQYCVWCHRGIIDINHMEHARVCNCLDSAAECCVESCPCPRVGHGSNRTARAAP
jgi:hypothetical protein